jgi:hypothetical protein
MDDIEGRSTPFRRWEGRVKYWNGATGSQHQVRVLCEYAFYGHGYRAWGARSWSAYVHIPKEFQPRVRSGIIKLVSAVLTRESVPTGVEPLSTCYIDFRVIGSDTVPNESIG